MRMRLRSFVTVGLGLLVITVAYRLFLNVHSISVGGITGFCVLAETHFNIRYTISLVILNLGLFLLGLREKGIAYVARSCAAMVVLGLLLDIPFQLPEALQIQSRLSAMIIGSILSGAGFAIVVSQNTSTGGSELLGMVVTKKCPFLSTGLVMTGLDLLVIITGGFLEGFYSLPFSLAAMLLCNGTLDIVLFLLGGADTPAWVQRIKNTYPQVRKRVLEKRVTVNPYVLAAACLIIFIVFHEILMLGGVYVIPA